jgi:hypothetical protein
VTGDKRTKVTWDAKAVEAVKQDFLADADRAAIAELQSRFRKKGWRLKLESERDGTWTAIYYLRLEGVGTAPREVSAPTALDAARSAWETYSTDQV